MESNEDDFGKIMVEDNIFDDEDMDDESFIEYICPQCLQSFEEDG
jgi:hypothetical protein